jgi:hypothetical protein
MLPILETKLIFARRGLRRARYEGQEAADARRADQRSDPPAIRALSTFTQFDKSPDRGDARTGSLSAFSVTVVILPHHDRITSSETL